MGRRTTTAAEELARNDDAETAAASGSDAQTPCASEDASGDLSSLDRPARRRRRGGERGKKSRARSSNARDDALARQSPIARAVLSAERSTELMKARSRGVDDENRGSELPPPPSSAQGCRFVSRALSQVLLFASKDLRHWNRLSSVSKAWRSRVRQLRLPNSSKGYWPSRARFIDADMAMKQMLSPVSVNLAKI